MIERVFIDNVWSFVNFEWRPGPLVMLLGSNGAGKTSLLDVIRSVQRLVLGEAPLAAIFPDRSRTRWDDRREQTIEIDIRGNGGLYRYGLIVDHDPRYPGKPVIVRERLTFDDAWVLEVDGGELHQFTDTGAEPNAPARIKATRSGIRTVEATNDLKRLLWFKWWISGLWVLRPDPRVMDAKIEGMSADVLADNMVNFAAWYVYQLRQKPGIMFKANQALAQIIPGFLELCEQNGHLRVRFGDENDQHSFGYGHLSDGQKTLIALYIVRHMAAVPGKTLLIDEPDNYVTIREIQPWMMEVAEAALRKDGPQVWIVSHHPEKMNPLARDYGWVFYREGAGPTQVKRMTPPDAPDVAGEPTVRRPEDV